MGDNEDRMDGSPPAKDRNYLLIGVAVTLVLLAATVSIRLWMQVEELDARLAAANERQEALERRVTEEGDEAARLRQESRRAQARAGAAEQAQGQAEFERELAREQAERAEVDSEQARADAQRSRREYERLRDQRRVELARMKDALGRIVETERTPLGMVMHLGEDSLQFDFDKATIREGNREILSRIAGVLLASQGYRVYIYGHTDDQGPAAYNAGLSERRAATVRDYFVEAGLPADIISAEGFGESDPRMKGTSPEARSKNRRVEIGIVDTVVEYQRALDEPKP